MTQSGLGMSNKTVVAKLKKTIKYVKIEKQVLPTFENHNYFSIEYFKQ